MNTLESLTDRMTILCGGRPLEIFQEDGRWITTVWSDDRKYWIEFRLTENDLEEPDHVLESRWIVPALTNLDGVLFPERTKRVMAALKRQVEAIKAA